MFVILINVIFVQEFFRIRVLLLYDISFSYW
ncbi:hypothetical protein SNEBB_009412, partial [Seison nebaliae]